MVELVGMTRRGLLAAGMFVALPSLARAQPARAVRRDLHFQAWRNDKQIGEHSVSFQGGDQDFTATIAAELLVKVGPIPVMRYRHDARETWRGGRFAELETHSVTNGKLEQVRAVREADAVALTVGSRQFRAPANAHPLTHWNAAALDGPLFNPQDGAMMRESVTRGGPPIRLADGRMASNRYALAGKQQIIDWYDSDDAWAALKVRVIDGSWVEYRRV